MLADPVSVLLQMPYGSACYRRMQLDGGAWEITWLLHEEARRIRVDGPPHNAKVI